MPSPSSERYIRVRYRNWKGEIRVRTVRPVSLWWGSTEFHPTPQWLLKVWDPDKGERDFALADCDFVQPPR